jgi:hypothetical protein
VISLDFLSVGKLLQSSGPGSRNDIFWRSVKGRHYQMPASNMDMNMVAEALFDPKQLDFFSQKRIFLSFSMLQGAYKALCMLRPVITSRIEGWTPFPHYSYDPEAEPILMSFIVTQSLRHSTLGKSFLQQNRRQTEAGLFLHAFDMFDGSRALPLSEKGDYYYKCIHEKVVMPDVPATMSVKPQNLKTVVYLYMFATAVILMFGVLERIHNSKGRVIDSLRVFERKSRVMKRTRIRPATVNDVRTKNIYERTKPMGSRSAENLPDIQKTINCGRINCGETSSSIITVTSQRKQVQSIAVIVHQGIPDVDID